MDQLAEIYLTSVGRNAGLLLNVTPDRTGRIPEPDVKRLQAWTEWRRSTFATNRLQGAEVHAEPVAACRQGHGLDRILDGSIETWWQPEDWTKPMTLTFTLPEVVEFDLVQVQEAIREGQRLESFSVAVPGNNGWETVARGRAVGHMRLLKLPKPVRTRQLRLSLERFRVAPTLANMGLYRTNPSASPAP